MGFLSGLRGQRSAKDESSNTSSSPGEPIEGYDRMDGHKLMSRLHNYSQAQLLAIEDYERDHQNRIEIMQKLRFMRGAQPMEGYDDMSPGEVNSRLEEADMKTVKDVRAYEKKFANRADVLKVVARVHGERLAARPPKKPPAYQAGGGSHDSI